MEDPVDEAVLEAMKGLPAAPVRLLGLRGFCEALGDPEHNELGIYDDLLVRVIGTSIARFRASTDPGWKYIQRPVNPKGCAQLCCGDWNFRLGWHKGHPALVQAGVFRVNRLDARGRRVSTESGDDFAINNHSGGSEYTVGGFSAGCQILWVPEGAWGKTWHDYFDPIADAILPGASRNADLYAEAVARNVNVPYRLTDRLPALPVMSRL